MSAAQTAKVIRIAIDSLHAAHLAGVDFGRLAQLFETARAEGREITDEEINLLAAGSADALVELDGAIAARKGEPQA